MAESEIISTGRPRIAGPGATPCPASSSFRIRKAERLGLTYEEYTLEILERGRHLQIEDVERIAEIKQARAPAPSTIEAEEHSLIYACGHPDQGLEPFARYLRDAQ